MPYNPCHEIFLGQAADASDRSKMLFDLNCAATSRPTNFVVSAPQAGVLPVFSELRFGLAFVDEQCRRSSPTSKVERALLFAKSMKATVPTGVENSYFS
jgi:hypothetical protein